MRWVRRAAAKRNDGTGYAELEVDGMTRIAADAFALLEATLPFVFFDRRPDRHGEFSRA